MSLREARRRYEQGSLAKPEYIETMYRRYHAVLFDYAEYLSHTDIASIEISDQGVLSSNR